MKSVKKLSNISKNSKSSKVIKSSSKTPSNITLSNKKQNVNKKPLKSSKFDYRLIFLIIFLFITTYLITNFILDQNNNNSIKKSRTEYRIVKLQ